ncbi:Pre-rRNA-processing protein TSR2-domain-containing protein [Gongronella butleri]|nr:Pre-rRNA-processing protein TSR2-domain-containing protein [Gongronella butleri]
MAEHPNKVAFQRGVKLVLYSWTALRLAVEQDWGGVDSAEKRDWMVDLVTDYFGQHGKKVDIEEIEDILTQIMNDEFHTLLEDDSGYLVAKHLVEMFNQCIHGNFSGVELLESKCANLPSLASVQQQSGDDDDEEIDEDHDGEGDNDKQDDTNNDMDMDEAGPSNPTPSGPDADGWETVSRRR